jgi:two-component system, sporulation sensor kinase D
VPLFDWVLENLLKNAVNAIEGKGSIKVEISGNKIKKQVFIDVTDTGKGIHRSKFDTVFQPGYTTRKRGWGLGLSLTKRMVENYHNGQIFVRDSEVGKGTTFRIVLKNTKYDKQTTTR